MNRIYRSQHGFTIAELITVVAIIGVLAAAIFPVARFSFQRQKEIELRQRIRRITDAIDKYHDLRVKKAIKDPTNLTQGDYPKDLEELVEGVELLDGKEVKFLRPRDLIDPMTKKDEWDTRSTSDEPDSISTDKNNVWDVRSTSTKLSLDGKTRYNEW